MLAAIRITDPDRAAEGFMLLVKQGTVRAHRGEIYVCQESLLAVLDVHKISYEKVPIPVGLDYDYPR